MDLDRCQCHKEKPSIRPVAMLLLLFDARDPDGEGFEKLT
jgi:hypothetical protein